MLDVKGLHPLSQLPGPVVTAYLKISPDDASRHTLAPGHTVWLKKEAGSLVERLPESDRSLFRDAVHRIEELLAGRTPREKSQVETVARVAGRRRASALLTTSN
jgi:hypothetical protein